MYQMDAIDYAILEILKDDGRCTYSDIAEQVNLSRVAVRERIAAMKKEGIIHGFTVVIDAKAYQRLASVFMDVEVEPSKLVSVARTLAAKEEIAIVSQHTGVTGLHVHAYIDNVDRLSQFLEEHIYSIDGVKSIQSHLLIRQYKTNSYSHRPNISSVISGYKQPSKSAQSIEITGFIEKSKPPKIIFFYTLLPLTA